MSGFDPTKHKPKQFDDSPLPAGTYLMVLEHIERKTGKDSGRPYIRGRYRVISGPLSKRTFFSSIGIDLSKDGTAGRLAAFCTAAGIKERVDLDSDASLQKAWLNRPFKAEISQKRNGDYVNNDIKKYAIEAKQITRAELEILTAWRAEFLQNEQMKGGGSTDDFDDDDSFPDDDDAPGGAGADDDEDIPF